MSIIKKVFSLFSTKAPEPKEVDPLDLLALNLEKVKQEAKALDEFEASKKAEELKMLERKAKLASIDRELEVTFDHMTKGKKRVRKIEQRIASLKNQEQENLQKHLDKALKLRLKFEASLYEEEDEEETPPAPTLVPPVAPAPAPEEPDERPKTEKLVLNRGINPNVK